MADSRLGTNSQLEIGRLVMGAEAFKYGQIEELTISKEESIGRVEKIHQFLSAMKRCTDEKNQAIHMDEDKYVEIVDEMRQIFGEEIFPQGVYNWRGKEQIEGLRESLNHTIQDLMTRVNIDDMRISHILEELKQMLESMKKMGEMEQRMIEKALNRASGRG